MSTFRPLENVAGGAEAGELHETVRRRVLKRVLLVGALLAFGRTSQAQPPRAVHSFDSNGVAISYADGGDGVPVVLIHGFTGSASRHFDRPGVTSLPDTV
jgi:hypothetical protein